jgi:hypothetical protein
MLPAHEDRFPVADRAQPPPDHVPGDRCKVMRDRVDEPLSDRDMRPRGKLGAREPRLIVGREEGGHENFLSQ